MPRLIKNITSEIIEDKNALINKFTINSDIGLEDYISIYNFTGFLQNFISVVELDEFVDLRYHGLISNNNKTFTEIEISY